MTCFRGQTWTADKAVCLTLGALFTDSGSVFYSRLLSGDALNNSLQTTVTQSGQTLTTMSRAIRPSKDDRIANLAWAPNGGLGRVVIGKVIRLFVVEMIYYLLLAQFRSNRCTCQM